MMHHDLPIQSSIKLLATRRYSDAALADLTEFGSCHESGSGLHAVNR